jgi:class 3 adenylate cyclase
LSDDGPALLVVDDNEDNRYTLTRRLNREGYENLAIAENGQEALERMGERAFDLVLLDIMMPIMNGYEVLERIKADMALRDIPVIMISALEEMDSVIRCIKLGAEDYLPKPFNAALLRARIGASLEKKRLRDQEAGHLKQIETEKRRVDELLGATLPAAAVQELKSTNTVRPRRFNDVVVLFCDVVGFTTYCDQHAPEEVVGHLQDLVTCFEDIIQRHGLEKIKTVGDAVMATAGLLQLVEQPALAAVRCGLEMAEASRTLAANWEVRVGIHQGPVVAGVIGQRKYMYDIWGDTVNLASRIADEAEPGRVLVSSDTWPRLREHCQGSTKGLVAIKGKGNLELIECLEAG